MCVDHSKTVRAEKAAQALIYGKGSCRSRSFAGFIVPPVRGTSHAILRFPIRDGSFNIIGKWRDS